MLCYVRLLVKGLMTLQLFFVPAFYFSAYELCYILIWKQMEVTSV